MVRLADEAGGDAEGGRHVGALGEWVLADALQDLALDVGQEVLGVVVGAGDLPERLTARAGIMHEAGGVQLG